MKRMSWRLWVESMGAAATGLATIATIIAPDWIEEVFKVEPDSGSGALELAIVVALAAVTLALSLTAGWEWRHLRRGRAT